MKEKKKELEYFFKPLVLYLEDLEKIEKCFKQAGWKTEIETEDFVFESIEELKEQLVEKKQENYLTDLSFNAKKQTKKDLYERCYGWVRFYPNKNPHFRFLDDNIENRGLLSKIKELLDERERKGVLSDLFLIKSFAVCMLAIFFVPSLITKISPLNILQSVFSLLFLAVISILWGGWSLYIRATESTLVLLKRREQSSFWQRNKEKIFWRIIVPIIMLFLGAIISYFLKQ